MWGHYAKLLLSHAGAVRMRQPHPLTLTNSASHLRPRDVPTQLSSPSRHPASIARPYIPRALGAPFCQSPTGFGLQAQCGAVVLVEATSQPEQCPPHTHHYHHHTRSRHIIVTVQHYETCRLSLIMLHLQLETSARP